MTKEETQKILKILKVNYPNSFTRLSDDETYMYLELWSDAFKDIPCDLVAKAVKEIIDADTREFAPNIGQVKNQIFKRFEQSRADAGEVWEKVLHSCACDYDRAKRNFDRLPYNVQRAVGSPSWLQELGYTNVDSQTYMRKEFERKYQLVLAKEKEAVLSGHISFDEIQTNNTQPRHIDTGMKSVKALLGQDNAN